MRQYLCIHRLETLMKKSVLKPYLARIFILSLFFLVLIGASLTTPPGT